METNSEKFICCICGKEETGFGNNPYPVKKRHPILNSSNRCCGGCNASIVVPVRILLVSNDIVIER